MFVEKCCKELDDEKSEIVTFKDGMLQELESEKHLIEDIRFIAIKYKKLVADQRREKEKISQQVVQQKKIVENLEARLNLV